MTSKREKLQYAYVFFADLLTMAVSVLLAWLITDGLFGVLIPYTSTDWLQTLCLLFVAFVVTFFFFDQDKNIVTRSENEEISLSLRFNIALGLVYAGCMLLAKATMLDSRYFAVTVPAVNAVLLPFSHAILKRLLIRFQRSWGMETLVGVVTTSDRAERLIPEIQKDWSRRVVGVSLLEATPAAISTRVCGVEVKATFDGKGVLQPTDIALVLQNRLFLQRVQPFPERPARQPAARQRHCQRECKDSRVHGCTLHKVTSCGFPVV